jgi:hypothetical protein
MNREIDEFENWREASELFKLLYPRCKAIGTNRVQFIDYLGKDTDYTGYSEDRDGRGAYEKPGSCDIIFLIKEGKKTIILGRAYQSSGSGEGENHHYVQEDLLEELRRKVEKITKPKS